MNPGEDKDKSDTEKKNKKAEEVSSFHGLSLSSLSLSLCVCEYVKCGRVWCLGLYPICFI